MIILRLLMFISVLVPSKFGVSGGLFLNERGVGFIILTFLLVTVCAIWKLTFLQMAGLLRRMGLVAGKNL